MEYVQQIYNNIMHHSPRYSMGLAPIRKSKHLTVGKKKKEQKNFDCVSMNIKRNVDLTDLQVRLIKITVL